MITSLSMCNFQMLKVINIDTHVSACPMKLSAPNYRDSLEMMERVYTHEDYGTQVCRVFSDRLCLEEAKVSVRSPG